MGGIIFYLFKIVIKEHLELGGGIRRRQNASALPFSCHPFTQRTRRSKGCSNFLLTAGSTKSWAQLFVENAPTKSWKGKIGQKLKDFHT